MRSLHRARRVALAAATATLALGLSASAASADGQLRWTLENSYSSGCSAPPTPVNCTWLGFMTNPAVGPGARGTATPEEGAAGAIVSPTSPRGAGVFYTFGFPFTSTGSSGPIYTGGGSDSFEFDGKLSFIAPMPPDGHGITLTVVDPKVTLAGDGSGALYASGLMTPGSTPGAIAPYDRTKPIFDLDLATTTVVTDTDGTQTIGPIVPSIHEGGYAFPASFATGAGPERTPNTFGSFTLVLNSPEGPAGPAGPQGEKGDAAQGVRGPAGAPGVAGARGKRGKQGKQGKPGKSAKAKKKKNKHSKRKRLVRRATISLR